MDLSDYGPACLMVAKYHGKYYSLQYLRDLCGTTPEGVSLSGISHGAEIIGLRSLATKCTIEDLITKVPLLGSAMAGTLSGVSVVYPNGVRVEAPSADLGLLSRLIALA